MRSSTGTSDSQDLLISRYTGLICDLDGVVYRGATSVPGAVDALNRAMSRDVSIAFATNNASRSPDTVAEHLTELGVVPAEWSVVNSSQAAASYLAQRLSPRARVAAVGGPGVAQAITEAGLVAISARDPGDAPVEAVVQGLGSEVTWSELAEVAYLVQDGAVWVATNLDPTLPTPRGFAPGNGMLVAAVQAACGVSPHVVGKPEAALFELSRRRLGCDQASTLACGDRLDTDIAGANAAGLDSLFVLSGGHRLRDLVLADRPMRPTYVAADLTGLFDPAQRVQPMIDDLTDVTSSGTPELRPHDDRRESLRSIVSAAWAARDAGREVCEDPDVWQQLEARLIRPCM